MAGALALIGPGRLVAAPPGSAEEPSLAEIPDGALAGQVLYALPGKLPLIEKTYRPPNFDTPPEHFRSVVTPDNAFFVRWHLAGIPEVDARDWKPAIGADAPQTHRIDRWRSHARSDRPCPEAFRRLGSLRMVPSPCRSIDDVEPISRAVALAFQGLPKASL